MANKPTSEVLRPLRTAVLGDGAGLTDGQLLGCFVEHRDEAAFAALVRRHGPMVWGVCRRLLGRHDAEDAFQAAFLVLFRKAASVLPRERLAGWLHGVARRAALQARRATARRGAREKQAAAMAEPEAVEQDPWDDLRPLLDEELGRLPERYRAVLVLCDLEGRTRREAARQLGCAEGTVASRLARARGMLAHRLGRRGVALSGAALVSAAVPASVVASTVRAAGAGVISARVAHLTEGVGRAMLLTKLKAVTAVALLAAGLLGAGLGGSGLIERTRAAEGAAPPQKARPPSKAETEEAEVRLRAAEAQVKAAEAEVKQAEVELQHAEARLKAAQAALEFARAQAERARRVVGEKAGADKGRLPGGIPPTHALVRLDKDGRLVVRRVNARAEPRTTEEKTDEKGRTSRTWLELIETRVTTRHKLEDVRVYDMKGRPVEGKDLLILLKNLPKEERLALVKEADGLPLNPLHLRLYKDDTLLFDLSSAPALDDAPRPEEGVPPVAPPAK